MKNHKRQLLPIDRELLMTDPVTPKNFEFFNKRLVGVNNTTPYYNGIRGSANVFHFNAQDKMPQAFTHCIQTDTAMAQTCGTPGNESCRVLLKLAAH